MFINLSNHKSNAWGKEQYAEAVKYGDIVDLQFPNIDAEATSEEVRVLAEEYLHKIISEYEQPVVMVQGEFTFTYNLVHMLKEQGITVVAACSERKTIETVDENGVTLKKSEFIFVQFREY